MNQDPLKVYTNFYNDAMSADDTGDLDDLGEQKRIESCLLGVTNWWLDKYDRVEVLPLLDWQFGPEEKV